jgi:hypothetical protein
LIASKDGRLGTATANGGFVSKLYACDNEGWGSAILWSFGESPTLQSCVAVELVKVRDRCNEDLFEGPRYATKCSANGTAWDDGAVELRVVSQAQSSGDGKWIDLVLAILIATVVASW